MSAAKDWDDNVYWKISWRTSNEARLRRGGWKWNESVCLSEKEAREFVTFLINVRKINVERDKHAIQLFQCVRMSLQTEGERYQ